jgi:dTDP-4-dehydrorhamnose 3,5-epimerase
LTMLKFVPTGAADAWLIQHDVHRDSRGVFARTWSSDDFRNVGITFVPIQANVSTTNARATIRGMHFQRAPQEEAKLVRCSQGRIWDVITDLRPTSPTYRRSFGFEIGQGGSAAIFVPAGFAHGYQTLSDDVQVEYLMGERYAPELADGFRYDDPAAAISWPLPVRLVSDRDLAWPPLATRRVWLNKQADPPRNPEIVT